MQRQKEEKQCFYQNVQCVILKKSIFIKEQEASGLLSSLGIKILIQSEIPMVKVILVLKI